MRFTTRDLLMATALVAVYSAAVASGLLGDLQQLKASDAALYIFIAGVLRFISEVRARRLRKAAGPKLMGLRREVAWKAHFLIATCVVALGATNPAILGAQGTTAMVLYLVLASFVGLESRRAALHEVGMVDGEGIWRFDEARLRIEASRSAYRLRPVETVGGLRAWLADWPIVPPDRLEEVRAILAAKQGEEPPMDADRRG